MLWNPATREFKTLPSPHQITCPSTNSGFIRTSNLGFGVDAKTNDYKVVKIASCEEISPQAEVYSLGTNSWKAIDCQSPCFCFGGICTYLNGVCYWLASDVNGGKVLLSFDMADEVFQKTPLPNCCDWDSHQMGWNLTELRGSVALIVYEKLVDWKLFDVWLMTKRTC